MKKGRMLKNKYGFSLVEMIVAVSIMSIVALGAAYMMTNGQKAMQTVNGIQDFDALAALVRKGISSPAGCLATFPLPGPIVSGSPPPVNTVNNIYMPDGVKTLIQNNGSSSDFSNFKITIQSIGQITWQSYLMELTIQGTPRGEYLGSPTVTINELIPMSTWDLTHGLCTPSPVADGQFASRVFATASVGSVNGSWILIRSNTSFSVPIPPVGTVDYAIGTGAVTAAGPVLLNSPIAGVPVNQSVSSKGWTGMAVKVW
jgi:prepilin-type N-terminal cleavage/methylation domain-containing protein